MAEKTVIHYPLSSKQGPRGSHPFGKFAAAAKHSGKLHLLPRDATRSKMLDQRSLIVVGRDAEAVRSDAVNIVSHRLDGYVTERAIGFGNFQRNIR